MSVLVSCRTCRYSYRKFMPRFCSCITFPNRLHSIIGQQRPVCGGNVRALCVLRAEIFGEISKKTVWEAEGMQSFTLSANKSCPVPTFYTKARTDTQDSNKIQISLMIRLRLCHSSNSLFYRRPRVRWIPAQISCSCSTMSHAAYKKRSGRTIAKELPCKSFFIRNIS